MWNVGRHKRAQINETHQILESDFIILTLSSRRGVSGTLVKTGSICNELFCKLGSNVNGVIGRALKLIIKIMLRYILLR